jgi:hypothetical protein
VADVTVTGQLLHGKEKTVHADAVPPSDSYPIGRRCKLWPGGRCCSIVPERLQRIEKLQKIRSDQL